MADDHGQAHFDTMEEGHQAMLAALMTIITYHRDCNGTVQFADDAEEPADLRE